MEILKLAWKVLKFRFTATFTRDQQFNKTLRSFFILGFYQSHSRWQGIFSFFITFLIFGTVFLGSSMRFFKSLSSEKTEMKLIASMFVLRHLIVFCELLSFRARKTEIAEMIDNFHDLEDAEGDKCRKICDSIIRKFRKGFMAITLTLTFCNMIFFEKVLFLLPVAYEKADTYDFFSFICLVYFIHIVTYISGAISMELLPVISILKLEGLVTSLCAKIKDVTSRNLRENERKLDECMEYQAKVLK
jgi:hypothetical protein